MKSKKVYIPADTLRNLISSKSKNILHQLDHCTLSFAQLKEKTNISQDNLLYQLDNLIRGKLIKKKQRNDGPYYALTFKGSSLLHPENSRIIILSVFSVIALSVTITHVIQRFLQTIKNDQSSNLQTFDKNLMERGPSFLSTEPVQQVNNTLFPTSIAIVGLLLFLILITIAVWRYQKNKAQAL